MRTTLEIRGARENNLRNLDLEMPRDKLIVFTGVSGSGKSSLAFDTIYAEGQRRLMASMSTYARRFAQQLKKPKVDFVYGLSPVVSIEQKTITQNPRSTVGTLTDLSDYLRMLFATIGIPHCPYCQAPLKTLSSYQMMEHMLALPDGTKVEVRGPIFKIYGEDYPYLFEHVRTNGYRRMRIGDEPHDLGDEFELDEDRTYRLEVVLDEFVVEPGIDRQVVASLNLGMELTDNFLSFHPDAEGAPIDEFYRQYGCPDHGLVCGTLHHGSFTFNDPAGACVTCTGLGTLMRVLPEFLVPDRSRSLSGGAIIPEAFKITKDNWGGRFMYTLSRLHGFSLDTPFEDLPAEVVDLIFYGTRGQKIAIEIPPGAKMGQHYQGREISFPGVVPRIDQHYRWYLKQGKAHSEDYFRKIMVEDVCPDCDEGRLRKTRQMVLLGGKSLPEVGELHLRYLFDFLAGLKFPEKHREAGQIVLSELNGRLELLLNIGLDYLNLNRRSATLSGGESQRIRLSSQIGSGLMGMLYILDEPTTGLHLADIGRLLESLNRLVDAGHTVLVIEHNLEVVKAADWVIDLGPEGGHRGGELLVAGPPETVAATDNSATGNFLRELLAGYELSLGL